MPSSGKNDKEEIIIHMWLNKKEKRLDGRTGAKNKVAKNKVVQIMYGKNFLENSEQC